MKKLLSIAALIFTFHSFQAFMHTRLYIIPAYGPSCSGKLIINECGLGNSTYTLTVDGNNYFLGDPFFNNMCSGTYQIAFTATDGMSFYSFNATLNLSGSSTSIVYNTSPTVQPLTTIVTYMASSINCNGQISLNTTGGYAPISYAWYQNGNLLSGITSNTVTNLCPGNYGFSVIDASPYACGSGSGTGGFPYIPLDIESIDCFISSTDVTCYGYCDGIAEVIPVGNPMGVQMAMVAGPDNIMLPNITINQCAGNVFGNVQHYTGTMAFCFGLINEPDPLLIDVNVDQPSTSGTDGLATATVTGGIPIYDYNWNGTLTTNNTFSVGAGTYVVTVIDANGCQINTTYDVYNPLMITIGSIQHQTNATPNGQMNEVISGGVPPYTTYLNISSTLVSSDYTGLVAGNYEAVVVDSENNQASVEFTIGNALSINENNTEIVNIYPNPSNDIINIATLSNSIIEIRIVDLQGRIVESSPIISGSTNLTYSVANLTNGYYFIELIDSNNSMSRATFIKK
jgi:hypothetical protein